MKSVLLEFHNGLEELIQFIEGSKIQQKIVTTYRKSETTSISIVPEGLSEKFQVFVSHYESFNNKKRFDYNTIIVSMYGFFESFIEDIIKAYISTLIEYTDSFNALPVKIIENHNELSAVLIQNLKMPKYQNVTSEEKIISNMHSCVKGDSNYYINLDAYTHHTSNFRKGSIDEFFAKAGIENISSLIVKYPKFEGNLIENEISKTIAFWKIDDLAERRNQVAHGGEVNLLSIDILLDYIEFFQLYSESLYAVLQMEAIRHCLEKNKNLYEFNKPIATYGQNIVCFDIENVKFSVGDVIYAKTNNPAEPIKFGIIQSIQINQQNVPEINALGNMQIGIKVDFKVSDKYTYYIEQESKKGEVLEAI